MYKNKDYRRKPLSRSPKQIPFLVRTFYKKVEKQADNKEEIEKDKEIEQEQEIQLYLYLNSTFRDIVDQLKYQIDDCYRRDVTFKILNIFLDQNGLIKKKELATIHAVKTNKDDDWRSFNC
ncbi:hypothetical protein pb186bvf_007646 [Paramecium bursaria]